MKKVTLRKVKRADSDVALDYKEQMLKLISAPDDQQKGMNFEEMERVRPVYNKLRDATVHETGDTTVLLEDAEYEVLVAKLKKGNFVAFIPELDDMILLALDAPDHLVVETG